MANNKQKDNAELRELKKYVASLEAQVLELSQDSGYGILNRKAIDFELPQIEKISRSVVFLDVDYLHNFNERYGHEEANRRIRAALHIRSSDVLLRGRWYSGDEIIFILSEGDPDLFCERLSESFHSQGMSATIAFVPFSGKLEKDVQSAKAIVDRAKAARGSSSR